MNQRYAITSPAVDTKKLAKLERQIDAAEGTYVATGAALSLMQRLFPTSDQFEAHCRKLWGWAASTVYEKIQAAVIAAELRKFGVIPRNKEVAMALACIPQHQRKDAWSSAISDYGDRPTASQVAKVVESLTGRPPGALPGERSPEMVARIVSGLPQDAPERAELLGAAEAEAVEAQQRREPTPKDGHKARIDRIEELCGRLKKIHAGLPDVADRADNMLRRYFEVILSSKP